MVLLHFCDISVHLLYSTLLSINLQLNPEVHRHHKPWLCWVQSEHNGDWLAMAWGFVIAGQEKSIDLNKHVRHRLLPPHHPHQDCVNPLLTLESEEKLQSVQARNSRVCSFVLVYLYSVVKNDSNFSKCLFMEFINYSVSDLLVSVFLCLSGSVLLTLFRGN